LCWCSSLRGARCVCACVCMLNMFNTDENYVVVITFIHVSGRKFSRNNYTVPGEMGPLLDQVCIFLIKLVCP